MTLARVGLYSISVHGLDVPDLLRWAAREHIPFVHLRGGPRGVDVVRRSVAVLGGWRRLADHVGVPLTGVTADLDLADLLAGTAMARVAAGDELVRLGDAAAALGARWVRLLARTEPVGAYRQRLCCRDIPDLPVGLLVEPHHPGWLQPDASTALVRLLARSPRLRLLADTTQLATALRYPGATDIAPLLDYASVLHLSDDGAGQDWQGREAVARAAAARIAVGLQIEVAVEWTGADRSPTACLQRYREACAWWDRVLRRSGTAILRSGRGSELTTDQCIDREGAASHAYHRNQ